MGQKNRTIVRDGDIDVKSEKKKSPVVVLMEDDDDDELSIGTDLSKDLLLAGKNGNGMVHDEEQEHAPPPPPSIVLSDEKTSLDDNVGEGEESKAEIGKSAAAKKKKKKDKTVVENEVSKKEVSKHVRQILEILESRRKAEEKKEREEQERKAREEESCRIEEERRREVEEAKRKKKEKEKERLRKRKQEGKILTPKQKQNACRLEAMRRQFINVDLPIPTADNGFWEETSQRNGECVVNNVEEDVEVKKDLKEVIVEADMVKIEEIDSAVAKVGVKNFDEEETDGEEWDAKNWDNCVLALPAMSASKNVVYSHVETHDIRTEGNDGPCIEVAEHTRRMKSTTRSDEKTAPIINTSNLRSPICCILGHVDTGKTKLLDCIRCTNVQEGEAGGITQQIGATFFPIENIRERTKELKFNAELKVPGLLVIDTPGHEVFRNLRSRGSGLCDIAILVVDIMHGLEAQTIESLKHLERRNTQFIVALNKVDRLYGWKTCQNAPFVKAIKLQNNDVQDEFNMRLTQIITEFKEQGLNTELYYKNKDMGETYSIVPTSAISGEGIPDLLLLLIQWTQKTMVQRLTFSNEVQCTVLEVKAVEGLGTTIDVVLANGTLLKGDQIVVCGKQGPIVTRVRALLTTHPMKELRVKGSYLRHKELKATQGIKINAQGLDQAVVGSSLYIVGPDDDVEDTKNAVMQDFFRSDKLINKRGEGVHVQASTMGSLEALLEFLERPAVSIPVSSTSIGPVHKKDVMRASVMLQKKKEYAAILAFDVQVTTGARELADETGVEIFVADIIYRLSDQFKAYMDKLEAQKKEAAKEAIFPCVLKIIPTCVFNKKGPIVVGVRVAEGIAKVGTPICIPSRGCVDIGRIAAIEINSKLVDTATKGQIVAVKITSREPEEQQKILGEHFYIDDDLVSHLTNKSVEALEAYCKKDLSAEDLTLVKDLKRMFELRRRLYGTSF